MGHRWTAQFQDHDQSLLVELEAFEATLEPRTRVFSEAELRAYGKAAGEQPAAWGRFYELALLTGIRRTELAGMRWDELTIIPRIGHIDSKDGVWRIPAHRTKMKRSDHVVPITKHMAEILQRMFTRRHPGYQHVLTASNGKRPLSDFGRDQSHA